MKTLAVGIILVALVAGIVFIVAAPLYQRIGKFADKLLKPFKSNSKRRK